MNRTEELEAAIKRVEVELDKPAWSLVKRQARRWNAIKILWDAYGNGSQSESDYGSTIDLIIAVIEGSDRADEATDKQS